MTGRWARLRRSALAVATPMSVYWLFLALMFGAFSAVAFFEEPGGDSAMALAVIALVTFGGVAVGQLFSLLRLRDWVIIAATMAWWVVGSIYGTMLAGTVGELGGLVLFVVWFGPMFLTGGLWSLRVNRALFAAWVPLVFASGAAIIVAESAGRVDQWKAGAKWAVWDVFTFGLLALALVLMLAFLVARENHRLFLWRRGRHAPLEASLRESGRARPRLSLFGWVLLGMLAMVLAIGTALIAPYLWRTEASDEGNATSSGYEERQTPQTDRSGEDRSQKRGEDARAPLEKMREDLEPALQRTFDLGMFLLMLLMLLTAGMLVFWRPSKRLLMVRHLRRPWFEVPNTSRIVYGWRLVEIAMADLGVPPRPEEPAESLCRRALPRLERLAAGPQVHGLAEAAEIRDRVAYGLGVAPDDLVLMDRVAQWAYDTVWDRLGDWGQIKALYRGL